MLICLYAYMILGHQKQWQFLEKSVRENRISHAYLFSGQSQLGKRKVALEFIKFLFCQGTPHHFSSSPSGKTNFTKSGGGCQICLSCQYLEKGIHPDLFFIQPQKREIQISQIRDLNWKLSLYPSISPFKAALIDKAHLMNSEAQNCFLKTLEEPKGKAILILISEYPEALFPTILSRVQKIRFFPVTKSEIESYLIKKGISLQEAKKIASISFGKPGLAIEFLENPQKLENQDRKIKEITKLIQSDLSFRFQYIKGLISKKESPKEVLEIWLRCFREILLAKMRGSFSHYSLNKLKNLIQVLERINFLISTTNINQRLALEQIMLEL